MRIELIFNSSAYDNHLHSTCLYMYNVPMVSFGCIAYAAFTHRCRCCENGASQ